MRIEYDTDIDFGANDFTVSIWVKKLNGNVSWNNAVAVGKWQTGGALASCEWYLNMSNGSTGTGNATQFTIVSGTTRYDANGPSLSMNNWHHLVGVREGDYIRFYVNGTLANSTFVGTASINNVANQHMLIGRTGAGNYTNAGIDELSIYNRALSAAEVGELFGLGCGDFDVAGEELVEGYRYGFNGMEKDDEVKGGGNHMTTEWRQYDSRLGRWLSREPKPVAWESEYAAFRNNPIYYSDPNGDWVKGAGLWKNLTQSDGRIYANRAASKHNDSKVSKNDNGTFDVNYMNIDERGDLSYVTESYDGEGPKPFQTSSVGMLSAESLAIVGDFDFYDFYSNYASAAIMTKNWAKGGGASYIVYANTSEAKAMMDAPGVNLARDYFYSERNIDPSKTGVTNFGAGFGIPGAIDAGLDATEQFVGSYSVEIRVHNDKLIFYLMNTTSLKSGGYGILPEYERSTFKYGGNMRQMYIWAEPLKQ